MSPSGLRIHRTPPVAVMASEYPAVSHTFIFREIALLRQQGQGVVTVSVNRPRRVDVMTPPEQADAAATTVLKTRNPLRLAAGQIALAKLGLKAWGRVMARTLSLCLRGPKSPVKALGYLAEAGVLARCLAATGADHVHVHFANPAATVAWLLRASGRFSFSVSVHGPDEFCNQREDLFVEKMREATFVRAISAFCASQIMRSLPHAMWDKVAVARLGVDTAVYTPRPDPENAVPRILCVGRLCSAKAQHLLLDALAGLDPAATPWRATLVGDGPDRASLASRADALGLSARLDLTGALGQDRVREHYRHADIFVLPSFAEGLPVVLMEAMAMGLPCLSTRIAGIPELIEDGVSGLLVPAGDAGALGHALSRLLTDAGLRRRLGRAGREAVVRDYDATANARKAAALFAAWKDGVP